MYEGIVSSLLIRVQEQERERFAKRLRRMRALESGNATGPGWRSPASVTRREPEETHTGPRRPLRLHPHVRWIRAMQRAEANV
jgi:hypothetical protein